jgi:hypothetical protein
VFDYFGADEYKYVTLNATTGEVEIGYYVDGRYYVDIAADAGIMPNTDYTVTLTMFGSTATVAVNGASAVTHTFNSILNDGLFGVTDVSGGTRFDNVVVRTDDPGYGSEVSAPMPLMVSGGAVEGVDTERLDSVLAKQVADRAADMLEALPGVTAEQLAALPVEVADLPGAHLAVWQGNRIVVDHNAAGHGWFAGVGSPEDRIDLLSVLMHEYGHAMGLGHDAGIDFMAKELGVGQRFTVGEAGTARVFDENAGDFLAGDSEDVLVIEADSVPAGSGLIRW